MSISAYITNLGKYNEGYLVGKWVKFPISPGELQEVFKEIRLDGVRYEEFFITDYEIDWDISGIASMLSEYENLEEINYLASLLDELDKGEQEKFEAAISYGDNTGSVKSLINLSQNLDCYEFYPGVTTDEELGYYLIDELCALEIPENLANYFDYEAYGRDAHLSGGALTDTGYIENNESNFIEYYNGKVIPEEYKLFGVSEIGEL